MQGTYNVSLVALSVVVAVFVSFISLKLTARVSRSRGALAFLWLLGGAVIMGCGIWSMHFIGMLAFSLPVPMSYDVGQTLLSLVIAVTISGFALALASRSRLTGRHLAGGGVLMGAGISAMHYSGMSAIQIVPMIRYEWDLVLASIAIAIGASWVALWLAFRLRRRRTWQANLAAAGGAIVMGLAISGMHYTGMAASRFAPGSYCIGAVGANTGGWLAITVSVVAFALLTIASILLFYDAHLQTTRRYARQLQRANARLRHVAMHDVLTGLPNRLLFADRLNQAIARAERDPQHFALLVVDLDRFKEINDSLGHAAGDTLLAEAAVRLKAPLRETDTVARIGGDEFVLLLNDIADPRDVETVVTKVFQHFSKPFKLSGCEMHAYLSIGISIFPEDGVDAETLLKRADKAMYQAKKIGGNTFQFAAPEFARDHYFRRLSNGWKIRVNS
jgi:diguanylate cyclase (GGDEF)-like protein